MNRLASLSIVLLAGSVLSVSALADTGVINLGPEEIIKAKGKDIVVPGYSVPSFEDWNNDQLQGPDYRRGRRGRDREDPRLSQRGDRSGPLLRGLLLRQVERSGPDHHAGRVPGLFSPLGALERRRAQGPARRTRGRHGQSLPEHRERQRTVVRCRHDHQGGR